MLSHKMTPASADTCLSGLQETWESYCAQMIHHWLLFYSLLATKFPPYQ